VELAELEELRAADPWLAAQLEPRLVAGLTGHDAGAWSLEEMLSLPAAFGLATPSPSQRAICRIMRGLELDELADDRDVVALVGGDDAIDALPAAPPKEMVLIAGIRGGKSLIAAAAGVYQALHCDLAMLGPGEIARVSIVSLSLDIAAVVMGHLVGRVQASPALARLLVEEPGADSLLLHHPSGRQVEVKVVAGARAGGSLVARWCAGVIFDEATRMIGAGDGVINLDDARKAVLGRLLPGAQIIYLGSAWAPFGPVFAWHQRVFGRPSAQMVVLKATGPAMNPCWWTPERCTELRLADPVAAKTDIDSEFADQHGQLLPSAHIERATRDSAEDVPRAPLHHYVASMDPATRGNAWTFVVATVDSANRCSVVAAREWIGSPAAPLNPKDVLTEMADVMRVYGVRTVMSDQWSADALRTIAHGVGIGIDDSTQSSSAVYEMYKALETRLSQDTLSLPMHSQLTSDLRRIQRKVTQAGVSIVLPLTADGRHCDFAPAVARVAHVAIRCPDVPQPEPGSPEYMLEEQRKEKARVAARMRRRRATR
jgi:hypothetical protein